MNADAGGGLSLAGKKKKKKGGNYEREDLNENYKITPLK